VVFDEQLYHVNRPCVGSYETVGQKFFLGCLFKILQIIFVVILGFFETVDTILRSSRDVSYIFFDHAVNGGRCLANDFADLAKATLFQIQF